MSIHTSLKTDKSKYKRSVRKRHERLRSLLLQEKWDKEHSNVYALPKEKIIRYKIKKEKEEKKEVTPITEYATSTETQKKKKKSKDIGKIR